jgi:diacylglycerol kinase (ATP)
MEHLYFIVNPLAKNGYGLTIWKTVEIALRKENILYHVFFTEYAGHAKEIAEYIGIKDQKATVIAVGGDGTIHEVVNGTVDFPHLTVGTIPAGSGNDFARGFSIPRKPLEALQLLKTKLKQSPIYTDVGKMVNSQSKKIYFINNMGAGFDALIAAEANRSRLKAWFNRFNMGTVIYAIILMKHLFSYHCTGVTIMVDGKRYRFPATWFVTIANQPFYGGGMMISPDACPDDGELNIIVVHNLSKLKFLAVFISVFWGGHIRFKEVTTLKGRHISMISDEPIHVHTDGEEAGNTPFEVEIEQRTLAIVAGL